RDGKPRDGIEAMNEAAVRLAARREELRPVTRNRAPVVLGQWAVALRDAIGRRALEDGQLPDFGRDRLNDLDAGRARADDADALAGEVGIVRPARRMEALSRERFEARIVGQLPLRQRPRRRDQETSREALAVRGL